MSQQIVCGVCGTRQENAWDCAVCGAALHDRPRHWQVPVEPLEGLEPTRIGDGGNVAAARLPDLMTTAIVDGVEPLPERLEGLEPTSLSAPVELPPDPLAELEPTAFAPAPLPAPRMGTICRYCGTAWEPGGSIFCARCGMRVGEPPARASAGGEAGRATCPGCGLPDQKVGALCSNCHERVRAA